jgi:hypothetical protein
VEENALAGTKKSEGAVETPHTVDKSSVQHSQIATQWQTWKSEKFAPAGATSEGCFTKQSETQLHVRVEFGAQCSEQHA